MELVKAIHFNEKGQITVDKNCDRTCITFFDEPLDELTIKVFRDSAFSSNWALVSLQELPKYTDFSFCSQHYVTIQGGGWISIKEALEFLKPWIYQVDLFGPASILVHWYCPSTNNPKKVNFFTFIQSLEGKDYGVVEIPVATRYRGIEQSSVWRGRSSY